ncbi:SAVMC3_10250 family protein [Actinocrispum sp. NPDC049592]|uniref:SAVMC3_10250 family protein n=1 Tax=Actinocrispum sp. NPDC049592 TaxID=3154835 RepID=UPI00341AD5DE
MLIDRVQHLPSTYVIEHRIGIDVRLRAVLCLTNVGRSKMAWRSMRELVYLSERKLLEEFALGRRWSRRIKFEGSLKIPIIGELKFASEPDVPRATSRDIDRVLKKLDKMGRYAKWFQDDSLSPGEWVNFEAPLAYDILTFEGLAPIVVFHAWPGQDGGTFLLHGSPQSLVGFGKVTGTPVAGGFGSATHEFRHLLERLAEGPNGRDSHTPAGKADTLTALKRLIGALDYDFFNEKSQYRNVPTFSALMAGFARVTFAYGSWLAATPLYIEYVAPYDESQ